MVEITEHEKLTLQPDDPFNTTITDNSTGKVVYVVSSEHVDKNIITTVRNGDGNMIASFESKNKHSDSDTVKIGNAPPVVVRSWLRKSKIPFKEYVKSFDTSINYLRSADLKHVGIRRF